ncbi:hypothetical protein JCM11251_003960 [Rhodosporidiobolus azoricus]
MLTRFAAKRVFADAMEPLKKKKPPACDRCKAKRVLCHPNPDGCPRCIEKGVTCTTTPVVRRKPQKKNQPVASSAASSGTTTPTNSLKIATDFESRAEPVLEPSTSQIPYSTAGDLAPLPAFALPTFPTELPNPLPLVQVPEPPSGSASGGISAPTSITPELAEHLHFCFYNTTFVDHPLLRNFALRPIFESCAFHIDTLPLSRRVLAYAVISLGALFSFSPSIIGPDPLADGRPLPTSFADLETAGNEGRDLRVFGRRRAKACRELADKAEKLAKEADVAFECSLENTVSALLLDGLVTAKSEATASRPWLSVYMRHLRELADQNHIATNKEHSSTIWAIHLSADIVSELDAGRLTSTYADHLALVGDECPDVAQLDKQLQDVLRAPIDQSSWPDVRPIPLIYLKAARDVTDHLLGTHARSQPLNHAALTSFLSTLSLLRSISNSFTRIVDQLLASSTDPLNRSLFPHSRLRKVRWTKQLALQGLRNFAIYTWTSLVLPLYRELQRREALLMEEERIASSEGTERSFEERQDGDKLRLALQHMREFVRMALLAKVEGLNHVSHMATFATIRKAQVVDCASAMAEEIETGAWVMDQKLAYVAQRFSAMLKIGGYAYSSPSIDAIIYRLETHLLTYTLSATTNSSNISSSTLTLQNPAPVSGSQYVPFTTDLSIYSSAPSLAPPPTAPASFASTSTTPVVEPFAFASLVAIPTPSPQNGSPATTEESSPSSALPGQHPHWHAPEVGVNVMSMPAASAGLRAGGAPPAEEDAGEERGWEAGPPTSPSSTHPLLDAQLCAQLASSTTASFGAAVGGGGLEGCGGMDQEMRDMAASLGLSGWGLW